MRHGLVAAAAVLAVSGPSLALAEQAAARVEAEVHEEPNPASRVTYRVPEGAPLSVSDDAVDGYRRVQLPNGVVGYVEERALELASAERPVEAVPPAGPPAAGPPPAAPAAPASRRPPVRRHAGFFSRVDLGLGYLRSSATLPAAASGGSSPTAVAGHGVAGGFGVAMGGAVAENLLLGAHAWGDVALSPTVTAGGRAVPLSSDSTVTLIGFGPTVDLYLMPSNVYLGLTPSVVLLHAQGARDSTNAQAGFGGRLAIGKEWWVSDGWGLGVAAHFSFAFNKDSAASTAPTWTTLGGGLALSATYN